MQDRKTLKVTEDTVELDAEGMEFFDFVWVILAFCGCHVVARLQFLFFVERQNGGRKIVSKPGTVAKLLTLRSKCWASHYTTKVSWIIMRVYQKKLSSMESNSLWASRWLNDQRGWQR